jgi:prepilin-type N-terminal cleavage/methylation domain-containing protein
MIKHQSLGTTKNAFSTVELIVVIAIIGIIMAIALPTYMTLIPRTETKSDAQAVRSLMQKARLTASAVQRPVRVLLDCTPATRQGGSKPCRLEAQLPIFNANGTIKEWTLMAGGRIFLHKGTEISYESTSNVRKARYDFFAPLFNNFYPVSGGAPRTYGVWGRDGFNDDSFVVVFTPSGEAISFCSLTMRFGNKNMSSGHDWILSLINSTGHIRLTEDRV